jgi:hypothetical protein
MVAGRPALLLHGFDTVDAAAPCRPVPWRLAGGRARRRLQPPPVAADPDRSARHQDRRPETRDIADIFNESPQEMRRRSPHDPDRFAPDWDAIAGEALVIHARNREALCLYAWHPYRYNPR